MRQLGILGLAVAVVVAAWLLLTLLSGGSTRYAPLEIPDEKADRATLLRSAHPLWRAQTGVFRPDDVLRLMRILVARLDEAEWHAVSAPVYVAWRGHRSVQSLQAEFADLNRTLLPRFSRSLSTDELEELIRIAETRQYDAEQIDSVLGEIIAAPLPARGYSGSRQAGLVVAALRAREFKRAETYLGGLKWPEALPEADRVAAIAPLRDLIRLQVRALEGNPDAAQATAVWIALGKDPLSRNTLLRLPEEVAAKAVDRLETAGQGAQAGSLIAGSTSDAALGPFWDPVIQGRIGKVASGGAQQTEAFATLVRAYAARYADGSYEYRQWWEVVNAKKNAHPNDFIGRARFLERALTVASTDWERFETCRALAAALESSQEYRQALSHLETTAAHVEDPELLSAFGALIYHAGRSVTDDAVRVRAQETAIHEDRLRGRMSQMKERLAAAKEQGRPSEELRLLESAIRDLEKQITE